MFELMNEGKTVFRFRVFSELEEAAQFLRGPGSGPTPDAF
jgi:hypothetical protein